MLTKYEYVWLRKIHFLDIVVTLDKLFIFSSFQ